MRSHSPLVKQTLEGSFYAWQTRKGLSILRLNSMFGLTACSDGELFVMAVREHESSVLPRRRLRGGTSSGWYQLFVVSAPVELGADTRIGNGPFDDDIAGRQRCPLGLRGHVVGLNLLSQVSLSSSNWTGSDFAQSQGLVGVRRGLFNPVPLLFVSTRLRDLFLNNHVRGWTSEVVNLT